MARQFERTLDRALDPAHDRPRRTASQRAGATLMTSRFQPSTGALRSLGRSLAARQTLSLVDHPNP
jgi:hypothetical protein